MAFKLEQLFRAGQVLSARLLNAFFAELERLGKFNVAPPLQLGDDPGGIRLAIALPEVWQIKLTGGGTDGKYDWTRQVADGPGTWADHPSGRTGTTSDNPAYEINANEDIDTGDEPVVRAWRDPISRALMFQLGSS